MLKQDGRFPHRQSILCHFQSPGGQDRFLTITFPNDLDERDRRWLSKSASELIAEQLKSESLVIIGDRLSPDMQKNIVHLNPNTRHLDIELLGKRQTGNRGNSEPWQDRQIEASKQSTPIAKRRQTNQPDQVLSFHRTPVADTPDLDNPPPKEVPRERIPLDPFKAQREKELLRQPNFRFPRFLTSGPISLVYTPSLGLAETDPRDRFVVDFSTSYSAEEYQGEVVKSLTQYKWSGTFTRYHLSASTRLWQKLGLILETGMGSHDSDIQLDVSSPTAPGGTTFLPNGKVGLGMLDTSITFNYLMESRHGLFRPHATIKLPTGSKRDLLSSGEADISLGASMEWSVDNWHLKGMASFTRAGDILIMDSAQAPVKSNGYLYAALGIGRTLDIWRGERVAASLNFMENPLGRLSDLDDLDDELLSLNASIEKDFSKTGSVRLEGSFGLSNSTPDGSGSLAFYFRF
jgi:hypothetical protein